MMKLINPKSIRVVRALFVIILGCLPLTLVFQNCSKGFKTASLSSTDGADPADQLGNCAQVDEPILISISAAGYIGFSSESLNVGSCAQVPVKLVSGDSMGQDFKANLIAYDSFNDPELINSQVGSVQILTGQRESDIFTVNMRAFENAKVITVQISEINRRQSSADANSKLDLIVKGADLQGVKFSQVSLGYYHACAVTDEGSTAGGRVYCWGNNYYGQLGNGLQIRTSVVAGNIKPALVQGISNAISVTVGFWHSCALLSDATVKCWGDNTYGSLGIGTIDNQGAATPIVVPNLSNVRSLDGGGFYTCANTNDNAVYCWGRNNYGQIGDGIVVNASTPPGASVNSPKLIPDLAATKISMSGDSACAALVDLTVKCWGKNDRAQLGNGLTVASSVPSSVSGLSGITQVSMGNWHACALNTSGQTFCWGDNSLGQLGQGNRNLTNQVVSVLSPLLDATKNISVGFDSTCARNGSDQLICWGDNPEGQLGTGTQNASDSPIKNLYNGTIKDFSISRFASCVINTDGKFSCWGSGQAIMDGGYNYSNNGKRFGTRTSLTGATKVSTGSYGGCAILSDQTVSCWGVDFASQSLEISSTVSTSMDARSVAGLSGATELSLGHHHACALLSDSTVSCWMLNPGGASSGQIGIANPQLSSRIVGTVYKVRNPGDTADLSGIKRIFSKVNSTCAIRADDSVVCWGAVPSGGSQIVQQLPITIPGLSQVQSLGLGHYHLCAVFLNSTVRCLFLTSTSTVQDIYSELNSINNATSVAVGIDNVCVLRSDKTAACSGANDINQSGVVSANVPPALSIPNLGGIAELVGLERNYCARLESGDVSCWGAADRGLTGEVRPSGEGSLPTLVGSQFTNIDIGSFHFCGVVADQKVRCVGSQASYFLYALDANGMVQRLVDVPFFLKRLVGEGPVAPMCYTLANFDVGCETAEGTYSARFGIRKSDRYLMPFPWINL